MTLRIAAASIASGEAPFAETLLFCPYRGVFLNRPLHLGKSFFAPAAPLYAPLGWSFGCMLRCILRPGTDDGPPVN